MNPLWVSRQFFFLILAELAVLFLGISTLMGLVFEYVSDEKEILCMPTYIFECHACRTTSELQASFAKYATRTREMTLGCHKCQLQKVTRLFNPPGVVASSAVKGGGSCCCPGGMCR